MPGRHHTETQPGDSVPSPIGTLVIVALAVVALIAGVAMIAVWIAPTAADGDDPPAIVVQPAASLPGPPATLGASPFGDLFPSTSPSTALTASASPSGSGTPTASALMGGSTSRAAASTVAPSPAVRVSGTVTASASPTPTVPDKLTASYAVTSSSADGFVADITVHNPTAAAQAWTVVVTYSSGTRITVTGYWSATPDATGRRLRFDGGPLPAGESYSFGFQAVTDKAGDVNPTACTVNGIDCVGF